MTGKVRVPVFTTGENNWDGDFEQVISNGGRFKPASAKRDKKQTMIDLWVITTNWFKTQLVYVPPRQGVSAAISE